MRSRIVKQTAAPTPSSISTHTVNRPLRIPGERVLVPPAPPPFSDRIGRSGQVLGREQASRAHPVEIDLSRFAPAASLEMDQPAEPSAEERWQERLDQAVATAREQADREGYERARAEFESDFHAKAEHLLNDAESLRAENAAFLERVETLLVSVAFRIAETVLESPLLQSARTASTEAVSAAIEKLASDGTLRVGLHPIDYLRLQEAGLVEQLTSAYRGLRWEPDADLAPGDWSVESPDSVIRRFERELIADLRERLGVLDPHDAQSDGGS